MPLKAILHNSNTTGNIAKWTAKLAKFQLDFQPCHAVKSQVLADFIVEWTPFPERSWGSESRFAIVRFCLLRRKIDSLSKRYLLKVLILEKL